MTERPRFETRHINPASELAPYLEDDATARARASLRALHSPYGAIRKVGPYLTSGGVSVYGAQAEYMDLDRYARKMTGLTGLDLGLSSSILPGAKGTTLHETYLRTLGEAAERLASSLDSIVGTARPTILASTDDLRAQGRDCVGAPELRPFTDEQLERDDFPFEPFEAATPTTWIEGETWFAGGRVLVPAQLVELVHMFVPGETRIGYATSVGTAAHSSFERALHGALAELFERDALALYWRTGVPPRPIRIDVAPRDPALRRLLGELRLQDHDVRFHLYPTDAPGLSVVSASRREEWLDRFGYSAGTGVGFDIESAMLSALEELGQGEVVNRSIVFAPQWDTSTAIAKLVGAEPGDDPRSLEDLVFKVLTYYAVPEHAEAVERWWTSGAPVDLSDLQAPAPDEPWPAMLGALGIDPVVFRLKWFDAPDVEVVRAFVPELILPSGLNHPMLGHRRFADLPVALGLTERPVAASDLNDAPTPFP